MREQERSDAWLATMGDKSFLFSAVRPRLPDVCQARAELGRALRSGRARAANGPSSSRASSRSPARMAAAPPSTRCGRTACRSISMPGSACSSSARRRGSSSPRFRPGGRAPRRAALRAQARRAGRAGLRGPAPPEAVGPPWRSSSGSPSVGGGPPRAGEGLLGRGLRPGAASRRSPVALVRQNGVPVAFAELMTTDLNREATVGVMRHSPRARPMRWSSCSPASRCTSSRSGSRR